MARSRNGRPAGGVLWDEGRQTDAPRRRRAPHWSSRDGWIAGAVIAVFLASLSAVLAACGDSPSRLGLPATAGTPGPTENSLYTGGIDLGCGAGALHPAPYVVRAGPGTSNEVALTFSSGPSIDPAGDWTSSILTTLERTHTPATFFVVGASAHTRPTLIAREAADGFTIGIETWDRPYMTKLTPTARAWELSSTAGAIHAVLGPHYCLPYWCPPYGDYNADVVAQSQAMGLTTVTWNVDSRDWASPGVAVIVHRVLSAAHPGSIIQLNDGYYGRQQTAQALPQIIQGLRALGLVPVTLAQLLAGSPSPTATASP